MANIHYRHPIVKFPKIRIESIESKEAICSSVRVGDDSLVIGILEYLQVNFYNGDYDHDDDDDVPAHL